MEGEATCYASTHSNPNFHPNRQAHYSLIEMRRLPDLNHVFDEDGTMYSVSSPVVQLRPHGLNLTRPVTLTMPHSATNASNPVLLRLPEDPNTNPDPTPHRTPHHDPF